MLSEKKQQQITEKLEKPPENVVFWTISNSQCGQCHQKLTKGSFLFMEQDKPLCMNCSGFSELVFLPAGDVKLTRHAKQHSKIYAVVVKFSRVRKRYERQGLLGSAGSAGSKPYN